MKDITETATIVPPGPILCAGSIVAFRFPNVPGSGDDPLKPRPCLVVRKEELGGHMFVELVFGGTQFPPKRRATDFFITQKRSMRAAGLHAATLFDFRRRVKVSVSHPGFVPHPVLKTPVLGHLLDVDKTRLQALRAKIEAYRDMAKARREARRQSRVPALPQDVVVELRRPKGKALRQSRQGEAL